MITRRHVLVAPLALVARPVLAAPAAEPWPLWERHDATNTAAITYPEWTTFLARHRRQGDDGIARVPYRAIPVADRATLDAGITRLAGVPISRASRAEQFAYWANLYNMLTVQTVLRHYPVKSIRDIAISPGWFSSGPWGAKLLEVEGTKLSLDDIEHRILRTIWRDPRIHYAVNCASIGCPNLPAVPFTAATTEAMLEAAARAFVNHPRGAAIERGRLITSSLYLWYRADFGGDQAGIIAHLRRYARPDFATALADIVQISEDRYDWALNDAA